MYNFSGGETEDRGYGRRYPLLVLSLLVTLLLTFLLAFLLFGDF